MVLEKGGNRSLFAAVKQNSCNTSDLDADCLENEVIQDTVPGSHACMHPVHSDFGFITVLYKYSLCM